MATAAGPGPLPPPPHADPACLPAGYRINEYQIEKPLGGGGFGITYLARDSNLQLPVAIKEYFPSELVMREADQSVRVRASNAEQQEKYDWGLERFLDEARALATFRHPNIIRVLRYFREHGTAYIVMEYESGQSLKRWVPGNAPLSQRALLSIIYPLLDGLEAVHKTGFLHRDIKPDNIYVRANGTPVLLDFGAARRVTPDHDLTNIVSPGYAPFEQYHSEGHQGPWSDIYSLGAVMYWMVTGKKPVESAARVMKDTMVPASQLAEAGVFGAALLEAIEWAMQPDEGRRPQSVPLLRAAILGSEQADPGTGHSDAHTKRPDPAAGYARSVSGSAASGASNAAKRNLLVTVMSLDLAGYPVRSADEQASLRKLLDELIAKALRGVPEESRIGIDTSDGAVVCFLGDPEEALHSAMLLRDLLGQRYRDQPTVRIGLHMGPVRVLPEVDGRANVEGDGINVAQRTMKFAQPNQVLVSRAYYDVISRISEETAGLFQYLGQFEDQYGRLHELHAISSRPRVTSTTPTMRHEPAADSARKLPLGQHQEALEPQKVLDPQEVHEVEMELTRHIGPVARILVGKAARLAPTIQALRESLAASIHESKARESFVAGANSAARAGRSQPASASWSAGRPTTPSRSTPSGSSAASGGGQAPNPSRSQSTTREAVSGELEMTADELTAIEQALSRFIGPMARMLVRKESGRASNFKALVEAVAATIDRPDQRELFRAALKRALPRRQQ